MRSEILIKKIINLQLTQENLMSANNQKRAQNNRKSGEEENKNINYKNLISQYYERDPQLNDIREEIRQITPEIDILQQLNSFEKQIDSLIKIKRYDVQEIYMKPPKQLKRILRLKLQKEDGKVRLFGSLYPKSSESAPKFTSFFKQIRIFANNQKNLILNWKKPVSNFSEKDGLSFQFPQNEPEPENIIVSLSQIFNPQRFEVDESLQKIVKMKRGTRVEVLQAFWEYVKQKKLQDMENKEIINADELIKNAFKAEKITFATINNRIRELLVPVEPAKLEIKGFKVEKTFDLIVQVEERPNVDILPFFAQKLNEQKNDHPYLSLNSKIKKYEKKYQEHAEKLRRHLAKREIYKNFKPSQIENIIKEQYKLLRILKSKQPVEEYNKLEYLMENEDEVQKEIKHYLEQINIERNQPHE